MADRPISFWRSFEWKGQSSIVFVFSVLIQCNRTDLTVQKFEITSRLSYDQKMGRPISVTVTSNFPSGSSTEETQNFTVGDGVSVFQSGSTLTNTNPNVTFSRINAPQVNSTYLRIAVSIDGGWGIKTVTTNISLVWLDLDVSRTSIPINDSETFIATNLPTGMVLRNSSLNKLDYSAVYYSAHDSVRAVQVTEIVNNAEVLFTPTSAELYQQFEGTLPTLSRTFYVCAAIFAPRQYTADDIYYVDNMAIAGYATRMVRVTIPSAGTFTTDTTVVSGTNHLASLQLSNSLYRYQVNAFRPGREDLQLVVWPSSQPYTWNVEYDTAIIAPWEIRSTQTLVYVALSVYMQNEYGVDHEILVGGIPITVTVNLDTNAITPAINFDISNVQDNTGNQTTYGKWLTLQSTINGTVGYTLKYGAVLSNLIIETNGETFNTSSFNTFQLKDNFNGEINVSLTDSRGITVTKQVIVPFYVWHYPSVIIDSYKRCLQDGTETDLGDYCKTIVTYDVSPIGNQNSKDISRVIPDPNGTGTVTVTDTLSAYTVQETYIFPANIEHSYTLSVTVIDDFASDVKIFALSTAGVIMDFLSGGKGIGLGKVAETQRMVEVNPEWRFRSANIDVKVGNSMVDLGTLLAQIQQRLTNGGL